jgi:hypothetical protein
MPSRSFHIRCVARRAPVLVVVALVGAQLLSSCTIAPPREIPAPAPPSTPPSTSIVPRNAEPPPPKVNLSGFPLPYRQGYADGCASATGSEHKDPARFSADMNYRTGWTDGKALCAKK